MGSSPAASTKKIRTSLVGVLVFLLQVGDLGSNTATSVAWVRISRLKIEEFTLQAQSVDIFTFGENPAARPWLPLCPYLWYLLHPKNLYTSPSPHTNIKDRHGFISATVFFHLIFITATKFVAISSILRRGLRGTVIQELPR